MLCNSHGAKNNSLVKQSLSSKSDDNSPNAFTSVISGLAPIFS